MMQDSHDVLISPRDAGNKPSGTPRDSKRHSKAETAPPTLWARIGGEEYERRSQIRFSLMNIEREVRCAHPPAHARVGGGGLSFSPSSTPR